jgi:hypothetical protein
MCPNLRHYHSICSERLRKDYAKPRTRWSVAQLRLEHIFFSLALQPLWALASVFSFMIILQTAGLIGRVISLSQGLYLITGQHKDRINT